MSLIGAITRKDLESVGHPLGLEVVGSTLGSLQPFFEMVGTLGGIPIRALIPALPGAGIPVEVRTPLAPRLDLGLRVVRDQIDPYRPLSVEADEPVRAEALLGDRWAKTEKGGVRTNATLRQALSPRFLKALLTDEEIVVSAVDPYHELFGDARKDTLIRMFRWTEELASLVQTSRQSVPVPAPLQPYEKAWMTFSDREGLTLETCPLSIFGLMGGASVNLTAIRRRTLGYDFELRVSFEAPLPFTFEIRPSKLRDRVAEWFGAGDSKVDNAAFDEAFELRFREEGNLPRLLCGRAIEILLDLSGRGEVTLNERGMKVKFREGAGPDELLRDLDKAQGVSRVLFANGFGLSSTGRAYRT
jgi:hypothetical protein